MSIKAVLFDLDGTLLPMDQDLFVKAYFGGLAKKLAPHGYDPEKLIPGIWGGVKAMVMNDGSVVNEEAFWRYFCQMFGEKAREDEPIFAEFYQMEFQKVQQVCGFAPEAAEVIALVKEAGRPLVLATNPIFPGIATESRMRWAGLNREDFVLYTTYENINSCKPNLSYYREILERIGCAPEECVMIGNDVGEDMIAEKLGMKVFLLTDCIINKENVDVSCYPHGSFGELKEYLKQILAE